MNDRICGKSKDGRHNFAIPGMDCINGCGVNQSILSGGLKKTEQSLFQPIVKKERNTRVNTPEQDFADRFYQWFEGGRKNFSRLTQLAIKYGVNQCEWAMGNVKEIGVHKIGYFAKILVNKNESSVSTKS